MLPPFTQLQATHVDQQVECISCRHLFTPSEEIVNSDQNTSVFNHARNVLLIDIRSEENVLKQIVTPEPDAQARVRETSSTQRVTDTIICPRCGTNNQNWVFIRANMQDNWRKIQSIKLGQYAIAILLILSIYQMVKADVPIQYQFILITLGIFFFLYVFPENLVKQWKDLYRQQQKQRFLPKNVTFWEQVPFSIWAVGTYFIILMFLLFVITIAIPWATYTVDKIISPERTVVKRIEEVLVALPEDPVLPIGSEAPTQTIIDAEPMRTSASLVQLIHIVNQVEQTCNLTPISSIIVNLESLRASNPVDPRAILIGDSLNDLYALQANYNTTCQRDLHQRAVNSINTLRSHQDNACINSNDLAACSLRDFLDNQIEDLTLLNPYILDNMPLDQRTLLPATATEFITANAVRTVLLRLHPIAAAPPSQDIQLRIEDNLEPLEEWANTAVSRNAWFTAGGTFLEIWLISFGLAGFISILTALTVIYQTAKQAQQNLPSPVYATVSRLSRVVIWEVAHTLAIPEITLEKVRWRGAHRNDMGGINLHGLLYDSTVVQQYSIPEDYVRAQHYVIQSDIWGHIVHAKIVDDVVPPTLNLADPIEAQQPRLP